jgi:hypothetical protein
LMKLKSVLVELSTRPTEEVTVPQVDHKAEASEIFNYLLKNLNR